jgi:altronate dehydratase
VTRRTGTPIAALGRAADLVVGDGGTVLLSETPELSGTEEEMVARAADPAVAETMHAMFAWWHSYAASGGSDFDANPSPGNRAGGISNIVETVLRLQACAYGEAVDDDGALRADAGRHRPRLRRHPHRERQRRRRRRSHRRPLCAVASGEPTASERLGYGDEEFTPWLDGITL